MTPELMGILTLLATIITQVMGYRALQPKIDKLEESLKGKIGVEQHAKKCGELHDTINAQGRTIAVLEERLKRIDERTAK